MAFLAKCNNVAISPRAGYTTNMKKTFIRLSGFLVLIMSLVLAGCSIGQQQNIEGQISVAVSMYPEAFLVEQIGGEYISTYSIVPAGVEPHEFEPSPADLSHITNSKLFIYHGANLDLWASRIANELDTNIVHVLNAADGISLIQNGDPHFWLDPIIMQSVAEKVSAELIKIDSIHAAEYEKNAAELTKKLTALDGEFNEGLRACRVRDVVTSHSAFAYLAERYNFTQLPISGISPNAEPSVKDMQNLISLLKEKNIRYVTFETLSSSRISETIGAEVGAKSLVLNPIEGLSSVNVSKGDDYFSLMRENLKTLKTAMECT